MTKRNDGLDYSDIQELATTVMKKHPYKTKNPHFNKEGVKFKWNEKCNRLISSADRSITQGTYSKDKHNKLYVDLSWALA